MAIIFYDEIKLINGKVNYIAVPKKYEIGDFRAGVKVKVILELINKDE